MSPDPKANPKGFENPIIGKQVKPGVKFEDPTFTEKPAVKPQVPPSPAKPGK